MGDTYKTIAKPSPETLFKDKKSKFYGYAYPITQAAEVKAIVDQLKRKHPSANHVCYAWQLGVEAIAFRVNDDGEPNNSAGLPIYGQIQAFKITNVLVAVVRIFGGTKLGVGGLITAYKTAAKNALQSSNIIERTLQERLTVSFEYAHLDKVMRIIKQRKLLIIAQNMQLNCMVTLSVRKRDAPKIKKQFEGMQGVTLEKKAIP
ncbi:MAG: YigZ family protein [Maribacter sp.]|nr:YigZ family protein [Maribacter sp.]